MILSPKPIKASSWWLA